MAVSVSEMMSKQAKLRLIDLRIDAGFESQVELAREARLAESTVWGAENGRTISYKTARKIVNALNARGMNTKIEDIDWKIEE